MTNVRWQAFSLLAVSVLAGRVFAAPITFNTALPVAKGEFVARIQGVVNQSGHDPSTANRDRNAQTMVSVLGYGVNRKLAMFGVLPYRDNELKLNTAGGQVTRSASGIGDFTFFGRYTVHQTDRPGSTFRVAPFLGAKAPTGDNNESDAIGTLPSSVQVGSGAWDGFAGVVATYQTLSYQIDGQLNYRTNGKANGFEAGDILRLDGSLQYRLKPKQLTGGVPGFLYGVVETNLIHREENKMNGITDPNSGGTTLFVAPGLQYVAKRWIAEVAVQIPVAQDLNGTALENDYIIRGGFRFNF